jgi:hypothetical protein
VSISRTQITANVRKALIRHWIDLECLCITPSRGVVRVSGELRTLRREVRHEGVVNLLQILEDEIRRCQGVDRVLFELNNWQKDLQGEWVCTRGAAARVAARTSPESPSE